jgi:predicted ATPase
VHRAARIAAAGHGGQILVSESVRQLAGADRLRDLGDHRLKDLAAPERIYQLGDADFPPLKSLNATNLPVQASPFIGREHELSEVVELLDDHSLVTLTGAGGSGKTRLALQTAAEVVDDHPDGVWFVSLAAVSDPALVEPTINHVLGAREALTEHLRGKRLLLLLDNLEQLLPDVAPLVAGLSAKVLATSRERLNVIGEQEYAVPTLPPAESVALFTERARQLKPSFQPDDAVSEIADRLDGLPLALELAAARVKVLTPVQILERLRLAVFAGGFSLEAAEEVCEIGLDDLQSLVDKSLVRQTDLGRFFILETLREFAVERLDESEAADSLRRAHAGWVRGLAVAALEELRGERQVEFLDRLTAEHANIRAALSYGIASKDAPLAPAIAGSLGRFWVFRGHDREGREWLDATRPRARIGRSRSCLGLHTSAHSHAC